MHTPLTVISHKKLPFLSRIIAALFFSAVLLSSSCNRQDEIRVSKNSKGSIVSDSAFPLELASRKIDTIVGVTAVIVSKFYLLNSSNHARPHSNVLAEMNTLFGYSFTIDTTWGVSVKDQYVSYYLHDKGTTSLDSSIRDVNLRVPPTDKDTDTCFFYS